MEPMLVYDLKALSVKLGITVRTLREYVRRGQLPASKVGRAYYITEEDLLTFLDDRKLER